MEIHNVNKGDVMPVVRDSALDYLRSKMSPISEEVFYQIAKNRHGLDLKLKKTAESHLSQSLSEMNREPRKEKNYIIENMFEPGELVILAGMQKSSKSLFNMDLLLGIASGGKIGNRFNIKTPQKVLLIDSEMPKGKNLHRIDDFKTLYQNHEVIDDNFHMTCLKETGEKLDLSTESGQACVENELQATKAKVLAIDNLGGVIPDGAERRETEWRKVFRWVRKINSKGIAVILVHHKNKSGEVGGTSFILRDIDLSLSIQRPKDWSQTDGNIIEVHFADVRYLSGDQVIPFSVKYYKENGKFKRDLNDIDPDSGEAVEVHVSESDIQKYNLDSELKVEIFRVAISGETFKRSFFENGEQGRSRSTIKKCLRDFCAASILEMDQYEYQLHSDLKKNYR